MDKEYLLITNNKTYWFDNKEDLIELMDSCKRRGQKILFCGKIKVEETYEEIQ